jgi:hypothetical protein
MLASATNRTLCLAFRYRFGIQLLDLFRTQRALERTMSGGIIDLLAIAPDGTLVLIDLKRDRTPREVVAQARATPAGSRSFAA